MSFVPVNPIPKMKKLIVSIQRPTVSNDIKTGSNPGCQELGWIDFMTIIIPKLRINAASLFSKQAVTKDKWTQQLSGIVPPLGKGDQLGTLISFGIS